MTKIGLASSPVLTPGKPIKIHQPSQPKVKFSGGDPSPSEVVDDTIRTAGSATPQPEAKPGFFESLLEPITQFFQELKTKLKEQFESLFPKISEAVKNLIDEITERVKGGIDEVSSPSSSHLRRAVSESNLPNGKSEV